MARITKALTNTEIERAKAKAKKYRLNDGHWLALLVKESGAKLWRFDYYKPNSKKRTEISLGNYPALTLAQARAIRDDYRALLAQGIDPQAHREQQAQEQAKAAGLTFYKVANDWLAYRKGRANFSVGYAKDVERLLERVFYPSLADKPIAEILPRDVIEILRPRQEAWNA